MTTTKDVPKCWWCGIPDPVDDGYRGTPPPELNLPAGVGVVICTPACPDRPPYAKVWRHPQWRRHLDVVA